MSSQNITHIIKNGGFPPIKYCLISSKSSKDDKNESNKQKTKERFFSNAPRQNINIRQLLSDTTKKPIIITEVIKNDNIEIIDSI
jgi:hypothetical protein